MFSSHARRRVGRREIEDTLAAHGLVPGPRRPAAAPLLGFDDDAFAERLRGALEGLGETFALLGRYLATRLDLVLIGDSLELARIAASKGAPKAALELLAGALQRAPSSEEVLAAEARVAMAAGLTAVAGRNDPSERRSRRRLVR